MLLKQASLLQVFSEPLQHVASIMTMGLTAHFLNLSGLWHLGWEGLSRRVWSPHVRELPPTRSSTASLGSSPWGAVLRVLVPPWLPRSLLTLIILLDSL